MKFTIKIMSTPSRRKSRLRSMRPFGSQNGCRHQSLCFAS